MPDPHISAAAQADIAHTLQWSFDQFGADAEARYAALIATAIGHAADSGIQTRLSGVEQAHVNSGYLLATTR